MNKSQKNVLDLYNKGLNDEEISKEIKLSLSTIMQYRKVLGLKSYFLLNKEKEDQLILNELICENTAYSIKKKFNCDDCRIKRIAMQNNIKLKSFKKMCDDRRVVKFNPFDEENKESNYWLGILASDGSVYENRIRLGLQEQDLNHIEKFRDFINPELKIVKTIKDKKHIMYNLSFRSIETKEYLHSIGITNQKSLIIDYKKPITIDFLRGVIDGDGYIRSDGTEVSIATGSIVFANQLKEFIKKTFNVNCTVRKTKPNLFCVGVYGGRQVNKVLEIYENADIYLERKYQKAISIRNNRTK